MEDVVDSLDGVLRDREIGQISFAEIDAGEMREVFAMAGDQAVDDAYLFAAIVAVAEVTGQNLRQAAEDVETASMRYNSPGYTGLRFPRGENENQPSAALWASCLPDTSPEQQAHVLPK